MAWAHEKSLWWRSVADTVWNYTFKWRTIKNDGAELKREVLERLRDDTLPPIVIEIE